MKEFLQDIYEKLDRKLEAECIRVKDKIPYTTQDGMYRTDMREENLFWWTNGFWAGMLWQMYHATGKEIYRKTAEYSEEALDRALDRFEGLHHDVGFQLNCSYGNGFRLTGNENYKKVLYQGAKSLSTRFNPVAGVIRSWDFVPKERDWKYPVIIDNMMNLELLMVASHVFNDDSLAYVARSHADVTMKNHFRVDYTSYHLVDYDPKDGHVRDKQTVQGYADESAWARGQAWALYGYTMMHRMAGDKRYLTQAEQVADMLLTRLPADGIPYWDFDAPNGNEYRDASAGAIMASAFLELSSLTYDAQCKQAYREMAEKQLRTLASPQYLAEPNTNCNFILKHGVGNWPGKSEVDVPLSYADYYFLEALLRYKQLYGAQ